MITRPEDLYARQLQSQEGEPAEENQTKTIPDSSDRSSTNPSGSSRSRNVQNNPGRNRSRQNNPNRSTARRKRSGQVLSARDPHYKIKMILMWILIVYFGGTLFFMYHFYPGTTIDGIRVSNRSVAGVENLFENRTRNFSLTLNGKDGSVDTLTSEDLGLHVEWNEEAVRDLMYQQSGFFWPVSIWIKRDLSTDKPLVYCEEETISNSLASLSCMDSTGKTPAVNASIVKSQDSQSFVIRKEEEGTLIDADQLLSVVIKSVDSLETSLDLEAELCYQQPEILADSDFAREKLEAANKALNTQIIYDLGKDRYEVLDADTFYDWLSVSSNLNLIVDTDSVNAYVDALADQYDDYTEGLWFDTAYGNRVYIPRRTYGWRISQTKEFYHIINDINAGEHVERFPDYAQTANNYTDTPWGDTYIEVDLSVQHLWCFKDGEIVLSSDFVSGSVKNDTETDTGIFYITGMVDGDVEMKGEDYVSHVSYFMEFYHEEGFHDATWRTTFGGNIYLTDGSHGCVNMPTDQAEALYKMVYVGYPVIVYTDDMTYVPSE